MGAGNEWANDDDSTPAPWWSCSVVLGALIAAAAVLAGSFGRYNRRGGPRG
ncbi:hypothetical protein [Umezawaea tangerina]|uniref:hypothetical protein n=1 Tax=Umezawaea tangerina TaxID=84725 RepID=UPI001473BD8C|nr:hypothetical protein [Umezawaea tangerina]